MKYTIFRLRFPKGLRIGQGRNDTAQMEIPADVLFSALINEAANRGKDHCNAILDLFKNHQLNLSDAFPFKDEEYFLPKPLLSQWNETGDSTEKKAFKKLQYIPLSHWEEFLQGKSNPHGLNQQFQDVGIEALDTKIKYAYDGDHAIYHMSYYRIHKNSGLYFILGYEEERQLQTFHQLLIDLSHTGIGGKKTSGWGRFKVEQAQLPIQMASKMDRGEKRMLLSTSMAEEEELDALLKENCSYGLIRRGGFIYSEHKDAQGEITKKKQTMHFFTSGSIFHRPFIGGIFQVGKGFAHPVYRYGKAMWLEV